MLSLRSILCFQCFAVPLSSLSLPLPLPCLCLQLTFGGEGYPPKGCMYTVDRVLAELPKLYDQPLITSLTQPWVRPPVDVAQCECVRPAAVPLICILHTVPQIV